MTTGHWIALAGGIAAMLALGVYLGRARVNRSWEDREADAMNRRPGKYARSWWPWRARKITLDDVEPTPDLRPPSAANDYDCSKLPIDKGAGSGRA